MSKCVVEIATWWALLENICKDLWTNAEQPQSATFDVLRQEPLRGSEITLGYIPSV